MSWRWEVNTLRFGGFLCTANVHFQLEFSKVAPDDLRPDFCFAPRSECKYSIIDLEHAEEVEAGDVRKAAWKVAGHSATGVG